MGWKKEALTILKGEFKGKSFCTSDAVNLLKRKKKYVAGTVYRILSDLSKKGKIKRIGRGLYIIKKVEFKDLKPRTITLPENVKKIKSLLERKGIKFMITGLPVLMNFVHLLPYRIIILIYTERGSGEYVVSILETKKIPVALNPKLNEIDLMLNIHHKDIVVVREVCEFYGKKNNVASVERALVDLYFESSRNRIPFPLAEVKRIFENAFNYTNVNFPRLIKCGRKRGIDKEMKLIIKKLSPGLPEKKIKRCGNICDRQGRPCPRYDIRTYPH